MGRGVSKTEMEAASRLQPRIKKIYGAASGNQANIQRVPDEDNKLHLWDKRPVVTP